MPHSQTARFSPFLTYSPFAPRVFFFTSPDTCVCLPPLPSLGMLDSCKNLPLQQTRKKRIRLPKYQRRYTRSASNSQLTRSGDHAESCISCRLLLLLLLSEHDLKLASSMCQMENKHRLLKHTTEDRCCPSQKQHRWNGHWFPLRPDSILLFSAVRHCFWYVRFSKLMSILVSNSSKC